MRIYYRLRDFYYDVKYGIKSIVEWLPIVWKDRHWSPECLLIVMRHKLVKMKKQHAETNLKCVGWEKNCNEMQKCIDSINFLLKEPLDIYLKMDYNQYEKDREKHKNYLFYTLKDNYENWWD